MVIGPTVIDHHRTWGSENISVCGHSGWISRRAGSDILGVMVGVEDGESTER